MNGTIERKGLIKITSTKVDKTWDDLQTCGYTGLAEKLKKKNCRLMDTLLKQENITWMK